MRVGFTLTGETPLLIHADDVEQSDRLKEWRDAPEHKNISVPGDDRSPAWTWQTYLYSDGEHVTCPADNIMAALRNAGAKMTMKRQTTFKSATQSGLVIPTEYCELRIDGKQVPISEIDEIRDQPFKVQCEKVKQHGFKLFVKRAAVGQTKHVRVRPRCEQWSVHGEIHVMVPEITMEVLDRLFEIAGRQSGLMDWRPSSKKSPGPYGMFSAKLKAM